VKPSTQLSDLPHFRIASVEQAGDGRLLRGQLTIPGLVPSDRAWLRTPSGHAVHGTVLDVGPTGVATFKTADSSAEALDAGTTLPIIHAFWDPQQVDAILDSQRQWTSVLFTLRAAVQHSIPGWQVLTDSATPTQPDQVVVDAAWDHEHCLICSAVISCGSIGFVDLEQNWLCQPCHEYYAVNHDLSFLMPNSRRPDA
jgi:hypothetical protein